MALSRNFSFAKNVSLFGRTKALEDKIDEFLDKLSESALLFRRALHIYLQEGASDEFESKLSHVNELESSADDLRRNIETQLYAHTLIPESRGDVLGLLENLDTLLNFMEGALWAFSIETPEIPESFHNEYRLLADEVVNSVESIVLASRAFFRNIEAVNDHMHKVMFFEKEADKVSIRRISSVSGVMISTPTVTMISPLASLVRASTAGSSSFPAARLPMFRSAERG